MKISNCCGAPNSSLSEDGPDYDDIGICPDCKDHCTFEEEEEENTDFTLEELETIERLKKSY